MTGSAQDSYSVFFPSNHTIQKQKKNSFLFIFVYFVVEHQSAPYLHTTCKLTLLHASNQPPLPSLPSLCSLLSRFLPPDAA